MACAAFRFYARSTGGELGQLYPVIAKEVECIAEKYPHRKLFLVILFLLPVPTSHSRQRYQTQILFCRSLFNTHRAAADQCNCRDRFRPAKQAPMLNKNPRENLTSSWLAFVRHDSLNVSGDACIGKLVRCVVRRRAYLDRPIRARPEQLGPPKPYFVPKSRAPVSCMCHYVDAEAAIRSSISIISRRGSPEPSIYLLLNSKHEVRINIKYRTATKLEQVLSPQPLSSFILHGTRASS